MKLKNLVLFLASAGFAFSQGVPVNVQKTPGTNAITGSLVIGAGKTLTASGGGTITASGVSAAGISGVIPIANLATGTPDGTKFVADDGTLKSVPGGGDALTANPLNQFAATTSSQFASVITNETGTAFVVLSDSPVFTTQITAPKIVYATSVIETSGSGTPEAAVTANIGSVFHRTDGSTATTLYVKESGTGNTGWAAVGGGGGGGIGGSTGSTDNALIRADGTGGATVQSSSSFVTDNGGMVVNKISSNISADYGFAIGTVAKASAPTSDQGVFTIISNDASPLQSFWSLITTATAGDRRVKLGVVEQGVGYKNVHISEDGGDLIVGKATSDGVNQLQVSGSFKTDSTTASTSATTGSGIFAGGVGISGALNVSDTVRLAKTGVDMGLYISGDAGRNRSVYYQTGTNVRWALYEDDASESGSNAGTNFWLTGFNDAGSGLADVFLAYRKTGNIIFGSDYGNYPSDTGAVVQVLGPTDTKSSGTALGLTVTRTYNQTSTAAATDLLINRTQTAVGSGAQLLADFQVGGTSKFKVSNTGAVTMATAAPLSITSGTNQRAGNATMVAGTATVSNTTVTANTIVMLTRKSTGGTIGFAVTYTVSAGASFTITSDNILDTSTYSYFLIEVP